MGTKQHRAVAIRLFCLAGAASLVWVGAPTPAWAHSRLQRTDPAASAVVRAPIGAVTLTFNEMVRGRFTTVVVSGPGGVSYSAGHVQVVDDDVHQAVYPLRSGDYTVAWRAVSADGHPVEGQFRFSVALPPGQEPTAGPPAPAKASSAPTASGVGGWWLWGGAAAGIAAVAALVVGWRRRAGAR